MQTKECLLFYVKSPENGKVKTRLARDIGDEHATELYKCFILDILATLATLPQRVCLCYTPEDAEFDLKKWLAEAYLYMRQQGSDLGERMCHSFYEAFQRGFERVVLIGSDLPDIPAQYIGRAFENLRTSDVVIGPAVDGGYYLLGFRQEAFLPGVFKDISWSTNIVFDQTLKTIRQAALNYSILPEWYDVDNLAELEQLYARNQQTPQRAQHTIAYWRTVKND